MLGFSCGRRWLPDDRLAPYLEDDDCVYGLFACMPFHLRKDIWAILRPRIEAIRDVCRSANVAELEGANEVFSPALKILNNVAKHESAMVPKTNL